MMSVFKRKSMHPCALRARECAQGDTRIHKTIGYHSSAHLVSRKGNPLIRPPSGQAHPLPAALLRVPNHLLRRDHQQLLLLAAGFDGQDRLPVLILDHL